MWLIRSRTPHATRDSQALVAECGAFLTGRYAQELDDSRDPVPAWAWLSILAHGDEDDLAAFASEDRRRRPPREAAIWRQAVGFLALEVLSQARRGRCPLVELQRTTLVPLELRLTAADTRVAPDPAGFVTMVLGALSARSVDRHLPPRPAMAEGPHPKAIGGTDEGRRR